MKYRIVYKIKRNNKEYTIEAGQNGWIPSKEIADRILKHYSAEKMLYRDRVLYLEKIDGEEIQLKRNPEDNKIIWTKDYAYFDAYEIGDYIDEDLAEVYINCVPPRSYSSGYFQIGEAHDSRYDESRDTYRSTYATFVRVSKNLWRYCGNCFCGQKIA